MANRRLARAKAALRTGKLGHSRLARAVALGILLGGASALPAAVQAANSDWTGATSDEWSDDSNWVVPPVNGSFVLIDALDPNDTHLRAPASVDAVLVGDQGEGRLVIEAGGQLDVVGTLPPETLQQSWVGVGLVVGNGVGSAGTVEVIGDGARLTVAEHVQIGQDGTGLLYVGNGGLAELAMHGMYTEVAVGSYFAPGQGSGRITVDGAGSVLRHAGGMNVTNGVLEILDGGLVESVERAEDADTAARWVDMVGSATTLEQQASDSGTATVSGAGSAWTSRNYLQIGYGGTGTLQVLDGGSATFTDFTYVGNRSREIGEDGRWTGEYLYGNGSLLVSGAGSSFDLESQDFPMGLRVGLYGQGGVRVEQGGAANIDTIAVVGDNGVGTLEVDSGGTMTVDGTDENGIGLTIGNAAGSDGWVNINGGGSTLTVDAGAQIGNAGNGYLGVTNGGVANLGLETAFSETVLGFTYYGWGADAASGYGSLYVAGAGSTVNYAGGINVLNGDVSVREGGQLVSVDRASDNGFWTDLVGWGVPAVPDSGFAGLYGNAHVEIDGEGSGWHSVNGLSVGSGGNGTLSIRNGGDASFAGYAEVGGISYVYDSPTGSPVEGIPPQAGSGLISVSGAGSTFTLNAAPGAPEWGLGLLEVGVNGSGYVQVDNGGLLTTAGGIYLGEQGQLVIGGWAEDESPLAAGTVATPSIQIDAGGSLEFRHNGFTTLGAAITGDGWIGASAGHSELSGDGSTFSGNVGIDQDAVLEVTGALGAGFLDVGYDSTGTLLVSEGGVVHAGSTVLGNVVGGSGNVVVSGAGSSFTVDGWASIGRDGHGSLGVFDGASASLAMTEGYSETTLGFGQYGWTEHPEQGQGSIVVDGAGSTLDYAGGLNVLNGSLQVSNGGQVASHDRGEGAWVDLIGWGVPADPDPEHGFGGLHGIAFASVSGEGSAWNSLNLLSVGEGGEGRLEVTAGGDADFSGYVRLGTTSYLFDAPGGSPMLDVPPATGQGSILVSGAGSSFDVNAFEGDESWQQGDLYAGYSIGSSGEVTIADGASSDVDGRLVAGRNGFGSVAILDGASMSVHGSDTNLIGMVVGESAGSDGQVFIDGTGATLSVDAGAQIGNAGSGYLGVSNGGVANLGLETAFSETVLGFTYYGWGADAASGYGSLQVSGPGSTVNYAGGINVLNGDVSVSDGGQLKGIDRASDNGFWTDLIGWGVPADPNSGFAGLYGNGYVDIDGEGSGWHTVNGLSVGSGGSGTLSIRNGGDASFAGYAEVGGVSYVFDAATGRPVEGIPPQAGSGMISVSGAGSTFTLNAAPGAPEWGLGLLEVGVNGSGYVQVDNGGLLTTAAGIHLGEQGHLMIGGWAEDESPLGAGTVTTPTIQVDAGGSLEFRHNGSTTLGVAITGDGWIGASAGHTTLSGDGSGFSGGVSIDQGATVEVTGDLGASYLDVGYEAAGSLLVSGGGVFHGGAATLGGSAGSSGNVVVTGEGSDFSVDGAIRIGRDGSGSLVVQDGGTANLGLSEWYSEATLGFGVYGWTEHPEQGHGAILVDGAGSTLNYAGGLNIFNGSLLVSGGGHVASQNRGDAQWVDVLGWGVPADPDPEHGFGGLHGIAFADVVGEGSAWHSVNMLSVGEGGEGALQVTDGGDASFSGYARLGTTSYLFDSPNGSPRLDVPPATGQGSVFVTGTGSTFDIDALEGDESWKQGDLYVGYSTGSSGEVTIADGASSDIDGRLVAGRLGAGAVSILDGGSMSVHGIDANLMGMVVGESAGAEGGVVVSGKDSILAVDGGAQIGNAGLGSLSVLDGGTAEIGLSTPFSEILLGFTYYGWGADAEEGYGSLVVDGAKSTLAYGGGLNVLNGEVTISNGATVASQARESDTGWLDLIGFGVAADPVPEDEFAGLYGSGVVTVTGRNSAWTSGNALTIANGGTGLLAVLDGGTASFVGDSYVGTLGYLFDAETKQPVEGVAGQQGSGSILVAGDRSRFTVAASGTQNGVLHVASGGVGTLQVRDGGTASVAGGIEVGANGYVLVGGIEEDDSFSEAGTLDTASITLSDRNAVFAFAHSTDGYRFDASILGTGRLLVGGDTTLTGDSSAFTGGVLVEGAPLTVTGALGGGIGVFGLEGAASLAVEDGGSVHLTGNDGNGFSAIFGFGAGSVGLATVSGEGSQLVADGGVQLGSAGMGGLEVLDGATASFGLVGAFSEVLLGLGNYGTGVDAAEGVGSLLVDGDGSALHYAGGLNVLNGEVLVSDGGLLQSHERDSDDAFWLDVVGFGLASATAGADGVQGAGEVTLVGSDTSWQSVNGLLVGAGGVGMLSILDGADAYFTGYAELGSDRGAADSNGNTINIAPGTGSLLVSGTGSTFTVAPVAGNDSLPGVLYIGTGGTGTATVSRGGTIAASGIEVGNGGTLVVGGPAKGKSFAAPGTIAAPVSLVGEDATLAFLHNDKHYVFDATISGDGFIHAGHGFTMLTADSSAFDGYTLVDGGATLSVNGSLGGDLMVAKDGRLQGSGTVEDLVVLGTLAPGNSPGTLSIAGDLVMETGAVFEAEIDPATGAYDAIAVTGNVNISEGTVLSVSKLGDAPMTPGISIDLIQTSETTTVEGQFSEVTGGSDFLGYGVDYTGGEINLNVTRSEDVTFESAVGAHFGGVGRTLDGLADDNPLMLLVFNELTSAAEAEQVLADMAGTMHADLRRELVDGSRHLRGALTDRLATAPDSGSGWWAQAMNDQGHMDAEGMWPSVEVQRSGMLVGYDMEVGATRLGAAIGTGTGEYDADGKLANADLRDRHVSVYGSSDFGAMRLGYGLGVSWTGIESERHFAIGDVQQDLMGDRDARTEQLFVEAARRYGTVEHRFFEPFLSVAHVRVHDGGFEEQGGLAALAVEGDVAAATFGKVGVRWALGGERAQWTGSVGMRYARGFDHGEADAGFVSGGDSFPIRGLGLDGNMLDISMGGRFELSERAHLWAGYESLMGGNSSNDGVKVQFSLDL